MAGIIGAAANNGQGGVGVCWNCPIMQIRARSAGAASVGDPGHIDRLASLVRSIRYAAGYTVENGRDEWVSAPRRADVINISLGNRREVCPAALQDAIHDAVRAGVPVVVAAANTDDGDQDASHYWLASCQNVIAVTSVKADGTPEPYSTLGNGITIAAPGGSASASGLSGYGELIGCTDPKEVRGVGTHGIVSSWMTSEAPPTSCYRHWAGTSMATPQVAGVVALIKSQSSSLTPSQISTILQKTAQVTACTGSGTGSCGAGMLDAYQAVKAATFQLNGSDVSCETGSGRFFCDVSINSGLAPLRVSWSGISNASVDPRDVNKRVISGTCGVGRSGSVRVTAVDTLGRTVSRDTSFWCSATPI